MKIIGLEIADVCTLFVYLVGITIIGVWMGKTIHNTTDFFVGGRRFGKLLSTFFAFGAGTHSDQAVSVAAKTYKTGMSGIWYQWLWLFVTPFYWLIAPIQRRCRAITTGDYFEARFARSVAMLFVVIGILNLMVNIGTMLKGSGAVIDATTGGEVNEDWAIALMTILFVTYGVVGGFAAAVVTERCRVGTFQLTSATSVEPPSGGPGSRLSGSTSPFRPRGSTPVTRWISRANFCSAVVNSRGPAMLASIS